MKKEFSIELHFFAGFYESIFYNSDMLYYETNDDENMEYLRERFDDKTLEPDDIDIDFETYKHDVSESFIKVFMNYAPEYIKSAKFDEIDSPMCYNFNRDRLFANVVLADDWREQVLKFMDENHDKVAEYIHIYHTSYDGFISYMSNDFNDWVKELKKDDCDERYISYITKYIMLINNGENIGEEIQCSTMDDVYLYEYLICTKEKQYTDEELAEQNGGAASAQMTNNND